MSLAPRNFQTAQALSSNRILVVGLLLLTGAALAILWWTQPAEQPAPPNDAVMFVPPEGGKGRRFGSRAYAAGEAVRLTLHAVVAVGGRDPLLACGVVALAQQSIPQTGPRPAAGSTAAVAAPLEAALLAGIEDRTPVQGPADNPHESRAFSLALLMARQYDARALAAAARRDVTYTHLFEQPGTYRGQVIHVEGQLRRLRRFDAPALAAAEGVPVHYEAWVFDPRNYNNPYCLVLADLPPGLEPGESLRRQVAFDGFFFKRYRYRAGDGWRDAPLFVGGRLYLNETPNPPDSAFSFSRAFLPTFLGLLIAIAAGAWGLSWWFRRGDWQVRQRVASALQRGSQPLFAPADEASDVLHRAGER